MIVDPTMLHAGASDSHLASRHAQAAAAQLDRTAALTGAFGDFGAADVFHRTVTAAHAHHVTTLDGHCRTLAGIGDRAHRAGRELVGMDQRNATQMRGVLCSYVI